MNNKKKLRRGRPKGSKSALGNGLKFPLNWIAAEFGIDRVGLLRKLAAKGIDYTGGVTIKQAFEVEVDRAEASRDRARLIKAEANTAEMVAAEKAGTLMLRKEAETLVAELAVGSRRKVMEAGYIPEASRKRLLKEFQALAKEMK